MIICKLPPEAAPGGPAGSGPIAMWECVHCSGETYYRPLDERLQPVGDLAIQDPGDKLALTSATVELAQAREPPGPASGTERLALAFVRRLLESGDATTYQVCQALIPWLLEARLLDAGGSVDVVRLLSRHFRHYESPSERSGLLTTWTVRELSQRERQALAEEAFRDWGLFARGHLN